MKYLVIRMLNARSVVFALLFVSFATGAPAEENSSQPVSVTLETTAASSYLWRGWVLNDSPTLQPAITVGWKNFSFSSWHSFSQRVPNQQAWTEHDLALTYSRSFRRWALSTAFTAFLFPDKAATEGNRTFEASASLAYDHWLQPSFTFAHDFKLGKGNYYFASVSHTFPLHRRVDLTGQLGLGLNQHQYQPITTISDFDAVLSSGIRVTRRITLTPSITQMAGNRSLFGSHRSYALKLSAPLLGAAD